MDVYLLLTDYRYFALSRKKWSKK